MNFFRPHNSPFVFFWIVLLSIALPFAQNLQFHVHGLDHGPVHHHDHDPTMMDSHHEHTAIKHLSIDTSHADHHDGVMQEMDAIPDITVQQSSTSVSSMDLLVLFILLFILGAYILYKPGIHHTFDIPPKRRFNLIPQLRAPPC
jgi:hypothetical protein